VIEKLISKTAAGKGYANINFEKDQTLPVGPAVFYIRLYNSFGGQSSYKRTVYVLPSNPFRLLLSPNTNFVTGTHSARAVKQDGHYFTAINVTLSNGNPFRVLVGSGFTWKFWNGGVEGTLIETGTGSFGGPISIRGFSTWGGWIVFDSPPGSSIFNLFDGREDMTIEIIMQREDVREVVTGTITARTMFQFGVNLIKVSPRDFTGQQSLDLQSAIAVTRSIYEEIDVSLDWLNWFIPDDQVGGFEFLTTFEEVFQLWDQWSSPDTNINIDAFISQVLIPTATGTADGLDGTVPGPTSHHGRTSGIVANKSGYVDASGQARLDIDYLAMLMGHELGHYLGLPHIDSPNNLLLSNSGTYDTTLTYEQYKTIIRHGWMVID
jgi:hypothetical protein